MLPPGYPIVIREGTEALRWAASMYERARRHVPELVSEARGDLTAAAQRHGGETMVIFFPTEEGMTREFARMESELNQFAQRLDGATDTQWANGSASQLFSVVDLGLLQSWEHPAPSPLLARLDIAPTEVEHRALQIRVLRQWLETYPGTDG